MLWTTSVLRPPRRFTTEVMPRLQRLTSETRKAPSMNTFVPIASHSPRAAVGPYIHPARHGDVQGGSGSVATGPASVDLNNANRPADTCDGFSEVNRSFASPFEPRVPARATVAAAALPKGARHEIEAIAAVPSSSSRSRS